MTYVLILNFVLFRNFLYSDHIDAKLLYDFFDTSDRPNNFIT